MCLSRNHTLESQITLQCIFGLYYVFLLYVCVSGDLPNGFIAGTNDMTDEKQNYQQIYPLLAKSTTMVTRQFYLPNCLELLSTSNFDSRRAAQGFSRIRTPQTLWTKHGHLCLWLPDNLLYHELEMNPGPSQKKPMCANCSKAVRKTQAAIL